MHTFLPPPSTSAAAPADASALSDCQTASLCGYGDKTHNDVHPQWDTLHRYYEYDNLDTTDFHLFPSALENSTWNGKTAQNQHCFNCLYL